MRFISALFSLLLFAFITCGLAAYKIHDLYYGQNISNEERVVTIPKGASLNKIASLLSKDGYISGVQKKILPYIVRLEGRGASLKAGEYQLPKQASLKEIIDIIEEGKSVMYKITLIEGETVHMALERIQKNDILEGEITTSPSEGMIYPDTYLFMRGQKRDDLIKNAVQKQKQHLDTFWAMRPETLPVETKEEFLTLASIIEKETALGAERPLVASVFINRLKQGMRLQTDPTIIYGITKGKGVLGRPIYKSDILKDTGYNTYQIDGLPPTPICNPSKETFEAIVNAPQTDYLFFVANGTGGHSFSKTYAEHQENVQIWRQIEARKKQAEKEIN